ncbi:Uncharacterised protein [Vibrio cholerae]|nr:Uncharacterised protein [Vibrio cholerae]CSD16226.1 Uncharacterised protein [Vibrio cholerae]
MTNKKPSITFHKPCSALSLNMSFSIKVPLGLKVSSDEKPSALTLIHAC